MDRLHEKLNEHLAAGNSEPSNMYLGRREHSDMIALAAPSMGVGVTHFDNPTEDTRLEWRGIKVFKVDADNHIAFS